MGQTKADLEAEIQDLQERVQELECALSVIARIARGDYVLAERAEEDEEDWDEDESDEDEAVEEGDEEEDELD